MTSERYGVLDRYWKPLTFVTIIILILSSTLLIYNQATTDSILKRDVELSGGKQITVEMFLCSCSLEEIRTTIPEVDVRMVGNSLTASFDSDLDENDIQSRLTDLGVTGIYSKKYIGPSFSDAQWRVAQLAVVVAFILMSIVIFVLFRTFVPSVGVILAAVTDIVVCMSILSLMDVRLSLPVLAALLMLIGYSVDTDVVLTTELLKTKGKDINGRIRDAMKTGLTMTLCALAALLAMYFVSQDPTLQQISFVLIIGLCVDIPATWLTNTGILRWYVRRKERSD
ncbi:MAG: preprotein translocase subunit SecF [Candidatus Aenigmatarchaeota archaeon]